MIVADTDVLIDYLRGKGAHERITAEIATGQLATTTVSVFELLSGARNNADREKIESLLGALTLLDLDEAAACRAAEIKGDLKSKGKEIGTADYLIAGICMKCAATLLTRNEKHFGRIEGLVIG